MSVVYRTEEGFRIVTFSAIFGMINAMPEAERNRAAKSILELLQQPPDSFHPIPADAFHDIDEAIKLFSELL